MEVATGRVTNQCAARHLQEFLAFLKQVARASPRRRLHVICDNDAHKHPVVRGWLAKPLRIQLHFTRPRRPGSSWSKCSSLVDRQALRRGDF